MTRLEEIAARLAEINTELETAEGDALTALENEANNLIAERTRLEADVQSRQALRSRIAAGTQTGVHVQTPAAAAASTAENVEAQEIRSFAGFIRGTVASMQQRDGEQNFTLSGNTALLPTTIARKVIARVKEICPILAGADVYHVKGTLKIPVYGNANDTHNISVGYATEFNELTADAGAFTSVDLTGYLIGALTLISRSLINSSDIDLVNWVAEKMATDIAAFVEGELLTGTGATYSHCTGALSTSNTLLAGSVSAISADNLIELQAKVPQVHQAAACWTMHPSTFTKVKKLKDGNGNYLLQYDITLAFPYRILGKPVYVSENMPEISSAAKAVLYGDYKGLGVNIREDITVEVLREKYATQHAVGIVGWVELDSKVEDPQKLAALVMSVA